MKDKYHLFVLRVVQCVLDERVAVAGVLRIIKEVAFDKALN
jgi:hypothetical protein